LAIVFDQIRNEVCREVWGFVPNRRVKPVHFANGFFRNVCGMSGFPRMLHGAAGGYRKGKARLSDWDFVQQMSGRYDGNDEQRALAHAKSLRSVLDLVLDQDRAIFPSEQFFSPTLTYYGHVSNDRSDNGTGRLMAEVLAAADGGDGVLDALRGCLGEPTDNVYLLTAPILDDREMGSAPDPTEESLVLVRESAALRSVQRSFAVMVGYWNNRVLEKTTFLQRVVTLAGFGLLLHLANRAGDEPDTFAPLLLCAPDTSSEVVQASRAALNEVRRRIHRAFEKGVRRQLEARGEDNLSAEAYRALVEDWLPFEEIGGMQPRTKPHYLRARARFARDLDSFLVGGMEPGAAFCRSAAGAAFAFMNQGQGESPESFGVSIGRACGLMYPRKQGRGDKYCQPSPQFLDMVVSSILGPGAEPLPLAREFWEKAWQDFGFLCGARPTHDADLLRERGIREASPEHLARNSSLLLQELVRMGYAQEYADDVAVIRAVGGSA